MRASTLFAITLSVLLGLGAVAAARYAGLFDKTIPPPPPPEQPAVIKVLVPNSNLYPDYAITPDMVSVRDYPLSKEEDKQYKEDRNKFLAKFLPGNPGAAALRIPKRNITAGMTLMEEFFEAPALPQSIPERLDPGTHAVNVSVAKSKAASGTIRVGDYVEVWLNTKITLGSGKEAKETTAAACVARPCKVIMKRNTIWPLMVADPEGKPISFTLQANPYRAALIEFAATRGEISLRPTQAPVGKPTGSFNNLASTEYANEDDRVDAINRSAYTIGDKDLVRVFNLPPPPPPAPPAPPPEPPIVTRRIVGTEMMKPALYDPKGGGPLIPLDPSKAPRATAPAQPAGTPTYSFGNSKAKAADAECETCGK